MNNDERIKFLSKNISVYENPRVKEILRSAEHNPLNLIREFCLGHYRGEDNPELKALTADFMFDLLLKLSSCEKQSRSEFDQNERIKFSEQKKTLARAFGLSPHVKNEGLRGKVHHHYRMNRIKKELSQDDAKALALQECGLSEDSGKNYFSGKNTMRNLEKEVKDAKQNWE
ncbi:hypothetical protein [Salinimonas sediminis]|uniref:Uncharacterized protein n=1 Tax=Salinimonas sediminis TaxID=2303538 RepID=A0A346NNC5_9ALTE|nr:hypothetical protein [Salinimonas sediminis]AXR07032.1 hypothetical protein D0Y50_12135 [Salinimonas sediminis]